MENHESELSRPPSEGLDTRCLLRNLKVNMSSSDCSQIVNKNVEMLFEERFANNIKAFIDIMWFHSFLALESHIFENPDDLDINFTSCLPRPCFLAIFYASLIVLHAQQLSSP